MTFPPTGSADPAEIADSVATATLSVAGVTRMHTGSYGEVSTYLPGRRVDGVRLRDGATEVHVVLSSTVPLMETAQTIRQVVAAIAPGHVDVYIEDLGEATGNDTGSDTGSDTGGPRHAVVTAGADPAVVPAAEIDRGI